ncbi:hypothetical protein CKM354_000745000 [Cercospora kikuchii]|uniref:Peroxisomal-coenzyme A synthetase n=1 Tax=Cercospora kikuchii TaxID=84275 RepID=A0A9P3CK74_9PEZI|nr:uncharacterized protein CKM354_000745000 [Cercospora kikuchii]GIZ44246.1 hypothetical protein CKM354_000745000 [Cercospora kikuchii]
MSTLSNAFSSTSNATAVVVPGPPVQEISYQKLYADVLSFQKKLAKLGITPGAAVSIAIPNNYAFIVSFLASAWQRGIAAPLNPAYKQSEFEFYIDDLSSALVLVPQGQADGPAVKAAKRYNAAVAECYQDVKTGEIVLDVKDNGKLAGKGNVTLEKAQPEDTALVLHTSGTTGRPKAVPLSHRNLTRTMLNIKNTYELSPADRTMLVMPLFHVHGLLAGFLAPLASGGSVIVPGAFSASTFWNQFVTHKANWYTAVPTIHQILLKTPSAWPNPMPNIRFIRSCSSPLSPKVFHDLEAAFKAPVLEAYAMTEASHQMTSNPLPSKGKRKPGSVGIGQGVEVVILNAEGKKLPRGQQGEISIKGTNVTKGYINNEKANQEAFTPDGYFRTGDQGYLDEDGYVIITGRIKELINKGGEKISPIELDNTLAQNPKVAEAVSFAIPDDLYGQDVGVAIVVKEGQNLSADELIQYMKEKVAKFKVPKKVFFVKVMPKTATGKIQRRNIADAMLKSEGQVKAKL